MRKGVFRALAGELDMRVAMGRIAPSRKNFCGANGARASGVLLGLKPFSGDRQRPSSDRQPIAERYRQEIAKGDIASRKRAVYGFNHQRGQNRSSCNVKVSDCK